MLRINSRTTIPDDELKEAFVRSPGPGGQNVNKVSTTVQLRFNVLKTESLPPPVKERLAALARKRMNLAGEILIVSRRSRHRERNRTTARERLADLIRKALIRPVIRKATRPTAASKKRRLTSKRKRSAIKQMRTRISGGEE